MCAHVQWVSGIYGDSKPTDACRCLCCNSSHTHAQHTPYYSTSSSLLQCASSGQHISTRRQKKDRTKRRNLESERERPNNRARHLLVVSCYGLSPSSSLIVQIHFLIHPHQQYWWSDKCIFQTFGSQQSFSLYLCPLSKGSRSIEVMKIQINQRQARSGALLSIQWSSVQAAL